jgi:hypothetical protein
VRWARARLSYLSQTVSWPRPMGHGQSLDGTGTAHSRADLLGLASSHPAVSNLTSFPRSLPFLSPSPHLAYLTRPARRATDPLLNINHHRTPSLVRLSHLPFVIVFNSTVALVSRARLRSSGPGLAPGNLSPLLTPAPYPCLPRIITFPILFFSLPKATRPFLSQLT